MDEETTTEEVKAEIPRAQNSQMNQNAGNGQFGSAPAPGHRRRVRRSRSGSSRMMEVKAAKKLALLSGMGTEHEMERAGLICSLLLLAGICAAHLLIADNTSGGGNPARHIDPLSTRLSTKSEQLFQSRLERFTEDMANLRTTNQLANGGWLQPLRVNMLLTEQRRRTVQRAHSPTPIPAGMPPPPPITRPSRQPNSASNSENQPPPEPSTSNHYPPHAIDDDGGEEPTLMDYDAIDSYWRWDIEQEKGPTNTIFVPQQQQLYDDAGYDAPDQQQQQWTTTNVEADEPAELLYQRDIQLLTEKSQFPELAILAQNGGYPIPTNGIAEEEEEEDYLLADISYPKWEIPTPQSPSSSSRQQQLGAQFTGRVLDNALFGAAGGNKIVPYQSPNNNNEDEGIGTELVNIPISTPSPSSTELINDEGSSSSSCVLIPFIPSPSSTTTPSDQPILFNDVSLAEAALIADNEDRTSDGDNAQHFEHTDPAESPDNIEEENPEEDDEMLLSALFPQLFPPPPPLLAIQRSPSLNSLLSADGNSNLEVILRELVTAEMLLNASLPPLPAPIPLAHHHFPSPYSPIGVAPIPMLQSPLSPFLEQLNQTQQMNVPSSSHSHQLAASLFIPPSDHDFYCLPPQNGMQLAVSTRCSSTTSSGFCSSGPTLDSYSPNDGTHQHEDSNGSNGPPAYRYEDKLVPKEKGKRKMGAFQGKRQIVGKREEKMMAPKAKGKRGRRSKDDSLVNQLDLPFPAAHLASMPYREYAALMQDGRLNADQKAMIKKIRRRGRNKLAARKCRERRLTKKEGEGEYDDDEEEAEEFDEEIDVGGVEEQQSVGYSPYQQQEEDGEEEAELYNPADISLYPSTSSSTAQYQFPNKMRSGRHPGEEGNYLQFISRTTPAKRSAAIRVQF